MNQFQVTLPQIDSAVNLTQGQNPNPPTSSHRDRTNCPEINSQREPQPEESTKKKAQGQNYNLSTSRTANFAEMSYHNSNCMYSPEGHDLLGRNFNIMNTQHSNTNPSASGYNSQNPRSGSSTNANAGPQKPNAPGNPGDNPFVQTYKAYQKSREQAIAISSNVNS